MVLPGDFGYVGPKYMQIMVLGENIDMTINMTY